MATDLSAVHGPISELFPRAVTQGDWERYRLSDEQVEFFRENGYVAGIRVLDEGQVAALREELAGWFQPEHEGFDLWYEYHSNESDDPGQRAVSCARGLADQAGVHDILWNPAWLVPAAQLLGGPVRFWHDQLFCKPARHGGVVAWHQDYSYWTRTTPMAHLTCWTGLDDSRVDNGCLQYVPGSHKWTPLPITGLAGKMDAIRGVLNDEQWEQFQKPVVIELKAGECAFHHPLLVHGSYGNKTERPRRAVVLNAFRDGVASDTDEVLLEGVPVIKTGEEMEGRFFPLLFDPASVGMEV